MLKPEEAEQIALFDWIRLHPNIAPYAFHIPNERKTSKQHGYKLKRMGVKPGVSDIFIAIPSLEYYGLFIELKAGKNKATPVQNQFLDDMREQGYQAVCLTGFEEARMFIESYLKYTTACTNSK